MVHVTEKYKLLKHHNTCGSTGNIENAKKFNLATYQLTQLLRANHVIGNLFARVMHVYCQILLKCYTDC
jgi:hypothetical protein